MSESRPVTILLRIGSIGVLAFLYLPIAVLAVYAFNDEPNPDLAARRLHAQVVRRCHCQPKPDEGDW